MIAITWIFSARLARLEIQARFENTGLGCLARVESLSMFQKKASEEAGLRFQPG